jgi:hypothetical protein
MVSYLNQQQQSINQIIEFCYVLRQNGSSLPPKVALMVLLFEYSIHYSFQ